jgi:hypothetical protein
MKLRVFVNISITSLLLCMVAHLTSPVESYALSGCGGSPEVLYARGSGSGLNAYENTELQTSLNKKLDGSKYDFVELDGSVSGANGLDYPAVPVIGKIWNNVNGAVATVAATSIGKYHDSIIKGQELMIAHMLYESKENPNKCWALVGYSQGAHVVGEALSDVRIKPLLGKIFYVGLFGDPKYNMWGYDAIPGKNIPWYRGDQAPMYSPGMQAGGFLQPRMPDYLPRSSNDSSKMFTEAGSWCYIDDIVCSGNALLGLNSDGYKAYPERSYNEMTAELVNAMTDSYGMGVLRGGETASNYCTAQDIVVAASMTPTVRRDWDVYTDGGVKVFVDNLFGGQCDARVAVLGFGDPGNPMPHLLQDFSSSEAQLKSTLTSLKSDNYPFDSDAYLQSQRDVGSVDVSRVLNSSLDVSWRDDAQKAVFMISDSGSLGLAMLDPSRVDPNAIYAKPEFNNLIQKSRSRGGVEFYGAPVRHYWKDNYQLQEGVAPFASEMSIYSGATAGMVLWPKSNCGACTWTSSDMNAIPDLLLHKPNITVPDLTVISGQRIPLPILYNDHSWGEINRKKSQGVPTNISYDFSCSNRQTGDVETSDSVTFGQTRDCMGVVNATFQLPGYCYICGIGQSNIGARVAAPFHLKVLPADYTPPARPAKPSSVVLNVDAITKTAMLTWSRPEDSTSKIVYKIIDSTGGILGMTDANRLTITDVDTNAAFPDITIVPWGESGEGESTSTLEAKTTYNLPDSDSGLSSISTNVAGLSVIPKQVLRPASSTSASSLLDDLSIIGNFGVVQPANNNAEESDDQNYLKVLADNDTQDSKTKSNKLVSSWAAQEYWLLIIFVLTIVISILTFRNSSNKNN